MNLRILLILMIAVAGLTLPTTAWPDLTIDDFIREPDLRDAELSPDGTHLAVIINKGDQRMVVVRNLEDPEFPIIGGFSEDIVRPSSLYWGNNERILIAMDVPLNFDKVQRDRKRADFDINEYIMLSQMVAVDKEMKNMVILMEDEPGLRANVSLSHVTNFLPNKVDHVLMTATRNYRRVQYEVNIVTGDADPVATGSSSTFRFLNDSDGSPLYRFDYLHISKAVEIFEYEGHGDWKRIDKIYLYRDDKDAIGIDGPIALKQDDLVYRKRDENTGFYSLVHFNRATRERRTFVSLPDQDIRGPLFDGRTDQIVGYSVERDFIRHVFFDEKRQALYNQIAEQIAEQIGECNFQVSGLAGEGQKALIRTWGADDPYSYYLWDFEKSQLAFLAHAYTDLTAASLSLPAITTYKARDGQPIRAYLLLPKDFDNAKTYPTIILPHGGPHARSRPVFDHFAQFLSTRGYVVVEPNFRGSVGYGHDFEVAGYKQWGGTMQDDVTDAVNFMVRKGYTDPEKVCIVGGSYGGYAALMGAIKTPSLFKCAISLNGVTHLAKLVEYDMRSIVDKIDRDETLFNRIGHPDDDREMLNRQSPALNADKISVPVMIVAGTEDDVVPFSQAKLMEKALKRAGADYKFIRLKDTGHNIFVSRENAATVFSAVEEFLETHLGPHPTDH